MAAVVKNLPANSGDVGLIPGEEDPLKKEMATHSSILAWKIPWTEIWLATVHGILQERILEWVPFPSPGDLPDPGVEPRSPAL